MLGTEECGRDPAQLNSTSGLVPEREGTDLELIRNDIDSILDAILTDIHRQDALLVKLRGDIPETQCSEPERIIPTSLLSKIKYIVEKLTEAERALSNQLAELEKII